MSLEFPRTFQKSEKWVGWAISPVLSTAGHRVEALGRCYRQLVYPVFSRELRRDWEN